MTQILLITAALVCNLLLNAEAVLANPHYTHPDALA